MALPQDQDVLFLVCEDARQEMGGKISLLGLYAGGSVVVLASEGEAPIIQGLCFYFCITGGEGTFLGRFELVDPNANPAINHEIGQLPKTAAGPLNVLLRFSPFQTVYGDWQVNLHLDDRVYTRSMRITRRDPPQG